ncbi:MAG: carbon storage regulator [Bryobacteraceae bacterium]|jgi:carbon storage regulator
MLIMRRRAGESFLIGGEIEIEVLEVSGTRVKLGIVAPDAVQIQRKETQITRDENVSAAGSVHRDRIFSLLEKVALGSSLQTVKTLTAVSPLTPQDS